MVLDRNRPNTAPQIATNENLEFLKIFLINKKMIFVAKTAKWPLLLSFQGKNVKTYIKVLYIF